MYGVINGGQLWKAKLEEVGFPPMMTVGQVAMVSKQTRRQVRRWAREDRLIWYWTRRGRRFWIGDVAELLYDREEGLRGRVSVGWWVRALRRWYHEWEITPIRKGVWVIERAPIRRVVVSRLWRDLRLADGLFTSGLVEDGVEDEQQI